MAAFPMRRALLLLVLALAAFWLWQRHTRPLGENPAVVPPLSPAAVALSQGSPQAHELNLPANTPKRDLAVLSGLLNEFTTCLKLRYLPPLGDNEDITAALTGRNRLQYVVIPPGHPALDGKGHLVDRWGTPYHFHARSAETFDLRSAGPDRVLFTGDDITLTPKEAAILLRKH
jgi:hypothetical protein